MRNPRETWRGVSGLRMSTLPVIMPMHCRAVPLRPPPRPRNLLRQQASWRPVEKALLVVGRHHSCYETNISQENPPHLASMPDPVKQILSNFRGFQTLNRTFSGHDWLQGATPSIRHSKAHRAMHSAPLAAVTTPSPCHKFGGHRCGAVQYLCQLHL